VEAWQKVLVHGALVGLLVTALPRVVLPVAAQQAAPSKMIEQSGANSSAPAAATQQREMELPDSPGVLRSKADDSSPQTSPTGQFGSAAASAPQSTPSESAQAASPQTQTQPAPQKPVGTATAEAPNASGIAASQPAGVAIAPAKQRRVRTIILRTGAIIGAGVAVGSVIALTQATPSKPPGAH
jgi:hypothetical protein